MALLHSTVHTSPQSEANTSQLNSKKKKETKEKEIHITVYTSDEDSLAGQEVNNSQKEKKAAGSTTMASNEKPTQFKVGEGCFAKVIHTDANSHFVNLNAKHLQVRGFPFWPAKVTKVSGNSINVVFFGTKEVASLALRDLAKVFISKRQ